MYMHKFFKTKEEAKAFQKKEGYGVLYSNAPRSRTKRDYMIEHDMAKGEGLGITPESHPFVVAWNE